MATDNPGSARLPIAMLTAIVVGAIMPILDSTIVSIGMRTLIREFGSTASTMQWVTTAYLLALAVAVPVAGWAQANFGGKRLWLFALVLFTAGSVACALSWNVGTLVGFRAFQGFGAGLLLALMQTLPAQEASRIGVGSLGKIIAMVSLPMAAGPILGPVLGGVVLTWLSWHWLFLINVPIGIVAIVLAALLLHDDRPDAQSRPRLDIAGLLAIGGGLTALLLALTNTATEGGVAHARVIIPLVIGAVLIAGFLAWPLTRDPARAVINVALLGLRSVASAAGAIFLVMAAMYAAQFLLPLYWQELRGYTVLHAAMLLIPQGVGALLTRTVAAWLTTRFGGRMVAIVAFLLVAATTLPFVFASATTPDWWLSGVLFLRGLALGALLIPVMMVAYLDVDHGDIPHATMLTRIGQQVGASFGTALVAVVLVSAAATSNATPQAGFQAAFLVAVILSLVGTVAALWLPGARATSARLGTPSPSPEPALTAPGPEHPSTNI